MNDNGELFLEKLRELCKAHRVFLVEEWLTDCDGLEMFTGIHFQGPDFWLPITDVLLDNEEEDN